MSRKKWGAASFFEKKGAGQGRKKYGAADKKRGPGKNIGGGRKKMPQGKGKKGAPKEGADPLPLKK